MMMVVVVGRHHLEVLVLESNDQITDQLFSFMSLYLQHLVVELAVEVVVVAVLLRQVHFEHPLPVLVEVELVVRQLFDR